MSEVNASETTKTAPTLEQFTNERENDARDFVLEEGPKELWSEIYDHWNETSEVIAAIYDDETARELISEFTEDKAYSHLEQAQEIFQELENNQEEVVHLNKSSETRRFSFALNVVGRDIDILNFVSPHDDPDTLELLKNISNAQENLNKLYSLCYFLADVGYGNKEGKILPEHYSFLAASSLKNTNLAYNFTHPPLIDYDEYIELQDTLDKEINKILQSWFHKDIDFLNITKDTPESFGKILKEISELGSEQSEFGGIESAMPFPSGIIGKDLEKLIDENAFTDDNDLAERERFLLLCNLRYLLEETHDTYIDEEYEKKYAKSKQKKS